MPFPAKQAFDPIDFAEHYINDEKKRTVTEQQSEKELAAKVPLKEKFYVVITNITAPLGLGVSATLTILLRFIAPIAAGGAAIALSFSTFMALSITGAVVALIIGFLAHKFYTREAIKDIGAQIKQLEEFSVAISEKKAVLNEKKFKSFQTLLTMKRSGLSDNHISQYINYMVGDPNHQQLDKIQDEKQRIAAKSRTIKRQEDIKLLLHEALNAPSHFSEENKEKIVRCFPSTDHIIKIPSSIPIIKPTIILGTFAFTGIFSLSFTSLAIITGLTALSITFPPIFVVLAMAAMVGVMIGYVVYQNRMNNAERSSEINYRRKLLDYIKQTDLNLEEGISKSQELIMNHNTTKSSRENQHIQTLEEKIRTLENENAQLQQQRRHRTLSQPEPVVNNESPAVAFTLWPKKIDIIAPPRTVPHEKAAYTPTT